MQRLITNALHHRDALNIVIILGSGPKASQAAEWDARFWNQLVVINNAWRIRADWDACVFPEDFPDKNRPPDPALNQLLIQAEQFVPQQNQFGGVVYAGGTMIFTTAYWALGVLKPDVMAFFGCDLVYPESGPTHFYGTGTPDPLRKDVTLQSLEAKAARLQLIAARHGCSCLNLSSDRSRLVFPRATLQNLSDVECIEPDQEAIDHVLMRERTLGYHVPSGRYWECAEQFDANALANVDALWLEAHASCQPASQTAWAG